MAFEEVTCPDYLATFLKNCQDVFKEKFQSHDYLFAAVFFLVIEVGFSPQNVKCAFNDSVFFDVRKLRSITSYNKELRSIITARPPNKPAVYKLSFALGDLRSDLCELQGCVTCDNTCLIINFLYFNHNKVETICLNTANYVKKSELGNEYLLSDQDRLSLVIKDKVCQKIKSIIMLEQFPGILPHLLRLPEDIQNQIARLLDAASLVNLASTCRFFHEVLSKEVNTKKVEVFRKKSVCYLSQFDHSWITEVLAEDASFLG